jgi:hypothetical protein
MDNSLLSSAAFPLNTRPSSADERYEQGFLKRIPNCQKCREHGQQSRVKGHKRVCPFRDCDCSKCQLVTERQRLMANQIKMRRRQGRGNSSKNTLARTNRMGGVHGGRNSISTTTGRDISALLNYLAQPRPRANTYPACAMSKPMADANVTPQLSPLQQQQQELFFPTTTANAIATLPAQPLMSTALANELMALKQPMPEQTLLTAPDVTQAVAASQQAGTNGMGDTSTLLALIDLMEKQRLISALNTVTNGTGAPLGLLQSAATALPPSVVAPTVNTQQSQNCAAMATLVAKLAALKAADGNNEAASIPYSALSLNLPQDVLSSINASFLDVCSM